MCPLSALARKIAGPHLRRPVLGVRAGRRREVRSAVAIFQAPAVFVLRDDVVLCLGDSLEPRRKERLQAVDLLPTRHWGLTGGIGNVLGGTGRRVRRDVARTIDE